LTADDVMRLSNWFMRMVAVLQNASLGPNVLRVYANSVTHRQQVKHFGSQDRYLPVLLSCTSVSSTRLVQTTSLCFMFRTHGTNIKRTIHFVFTVIHTLYNST